MYKFTERNGRLHSLTTFVLTCMLCSHGASPIKKIVTVLRCSLSGKFNYYSCQNLIWDSMSKTLKLNQKCNSILGCQSKTVTGLQIDVKTDGPMMATASSVISPVETAAHLTHYIALLPKRCESGIIFLTPVTPCPTLRCRPCTSVKKW